MSRKSMIRTGIAATGAAVALALVPGSANAAFDANHDTACENVATIAGIGASFQREAQLRWGAQMLAPDADPGSPFSEGFGYAAGGCSVFKSPADLGTQRATYEPRGSGDGRNAFGATGGVRNTNFAFGGADEPHTAAQLLVANAGPSAATGDDAVLHTIPVAQSAVAVDVKLPAGCTVAQTPTARRISRAALAGAFSANVSYDTWGEVLPSIAGSGCAAKPVKRVVRFDSSGTTFAFKRYLNAIDPASFPTSLGNTAWPNDSGATAVIRPSVNGAGALLDTLNAQTTDGGIGYADVASSRGRGFDWSGASDTSFWTHVERADGTYTSPAVNNNAGVTGVNRGSNCATAQYADRSTGLLPSTTQSWSNVDATGTTAAYAICALTYAFAWQEPSKANVGIPVGQPAITQDQARAVRDRLSYQLSTTAAAGGFQGGGQTILSAAGYQALPTAVLNVADDPVDGTGTDELNW